MNNTQILKKAIEKAIRYGYVFPIPEFMFTKDQMIENMIGNCYSIIFSHNFAEAFWKDDITRSYLYHLQQMVGAKKPLKYLEKFL